MPWHAADDLRDDMIFEAWYLMELRSGTQHKRTLQAAIDGLEDTKWTLTPDDDANRGPRLWENPIPVASGKTQNHVNTIAA